MPREIIFRGKHILTKEWIEGTPVILKCGGNGCRLFYKDAQSIHDSVAVSVDTLGQFIGELSKNGQKIFEGDIVALEQHPNTESEPYRAYGVVEFLDGGFIIRQIIGVTKSWCNSFYSPDGREFSWGELEIIGNTFDTPDLVRGLTT